MNSDFDVIIIGNGPAGVSAAFPLLESGLRVLLIDGGNMPSVPPPSTDFLNWRTHDRDHWKWMVGENFHALKMNDAVSPKLRAPPHEHVFADFHHQNKIVENEFVAIGSLASGGLSNSWGCGVARFSEQDLAAFPFSARDLSDSYSRVSARIGISGSANDDLSNYFGQDDSLQLPIEMDPIHTSIFERYHHKKVKLNLLGFKMGRSRVAALSSDMPGRKACNLSANCLWGCHRKSLYSATDELVSLRRYPNLTELSGFVVDSLSCINNEWRVSGVLTKNCVMQSFTSTKVVMAAGTLASTRLVLKALRRRDKTPMFSCPTAAFLLWIPRFLGTPKSLGFGLGQLSFTIDIPNKVTAFGSTFSTTGISVSEFARHVPLKRPLGIDVLSGLLGSCVVGNVFLPGHLTEARVQLDDNDSLIVSGSHKLEVPELMREIKKKLAKACVSLGGVLLPGSFTIGKLGSDIHYSGTLPMKLKPDIGQTFQTGEVVGLPGVYVVDGACLTSLPEKSHTLTIMANADRICRQLATR